MSPSERGEKMEEESWIAMPGEHEMERDRHGGNLTGEAQNRTTCWVSTDTHRSQSGGSNCVCVCENGTYQQSQEAGLWGLERV